MAATLSIPSTASASTYRHAYFQRVRSTVRASFRPRFAAYRPRYAASRSGFAHGRTAWRHPLARRAVAWGRPSFRRAAAYAPVAPATAAASLFGVIPNIAAPILGANPAPAAIATPRASVRASGGVQTGQASFYGLHSRTANGGRVGAATCAHRSLPFGTRVLVTNLANARQAVLTVNDRGPFVRGRIVDVSVGAAGALGMLHAGTAPVRVQVVGGPG